MRSKVIFVLAFTAIMIAWATHIRQRSASLQPAVPSETLTVKVPF